MCPCLGCAQVNLAAGEEAVFTAGAAFAPVVEVEPGVRVGLLICFDVFLPEPSRILALRKANLILIPTANGYPADYNPISRVHEGSTYDLMSMALSPHDTARSLHVPRRGTPVT